MCGIAGFVARPLKAETYSADWILDLYRMAEAVPPAPEGAEALGALIDSLEANFADLMSLGLSRTLAFNDDMRSKVEALVSVLEAQEAQLVELSKAGQTLFNPLIERVRDYAWQVRVEVLENIDRFRALAADDITTAVLPEQYTVSYFVEVVLQAVDRLEVRGRDSSGLSIQLVVPGFDADALGDLAQAYAERSSDPHLDHKAIVEATSDAGEPVLTFLFKTANLIGSLGDNGRLLRDAIRSDRLFWAIAVQASQLALLAHTRWASSGIISVLNCHPHNASTREDVTRTAPLGTMFVLNGDVDNHLALAKEIVASRQLNVDPRITTDAKIIPLAYRFENGTRTSHLQRFRASMGRLDGSMAIAALDAAIPGTLMLAQKGSGQGLHVADLKDGWMFASEAYGLAAQARQAFDLALSVQGGTVSLLTADSDQPIVRAIVTDDPVKVGREAIQIFPRDIFRGDFNYFLEKEINDGPASVAKTLQGRYRMRDDRVSFDDLPTDIWAKLRARMRRGGVNRVYVLGQGTAGVSALGVAYLIERALSYGTTAAKLPISAYRSSEFSAEVDKLQLEDALVIAISQSGTTTDTNRAVDVARERGAFVHAIVNRRNSELVRKSDSVIFTSDGRDVEMSVASTKAFYSQAVAGKLTALFLAQTLGAMNADNVRADMRELEALPRKIRAVLDADEHIKECARSLARRARYWATTGSGANQIAASEIRIKLSELCYKSIPVDYTEDKKHIDLSTEPLILVIAVDLDPGVVSDTQKEVAIFKAHNGRPIVFATEGSEAEALSHYAERLIEIPKIGAGLGYVLATVAGHIFGMHAAKAIDEGAQLLNAVLADLGQAATSGQSDDLAIATNGLWAFLESAAQGDHESGLGSQHAADLALAGRHLSVALTGTEAEISAAASKAIEVVRTAFEELRRPIDTIRHQAKTVTVGTSRPSDAIAPVVRDALADLEVSEDQLTADDRRVLSLLSGFVDQLSWSAALRVVNAATDPEIQVDGSDVPQALSDYKSYASPLGLLGAAFDYNAVAAGWVEDGCAFVIPVREEDGIGISRLAALGVSTHSSVSLARKISVLKGLGRYNNALRDWQAKFKADGEKMLEAHIAAIRPLDLLTDRTILLAPDKDSLRESA